MNFLARLVYFSNAVIFLVLTLCDAHLLLVIIFVVFTSISETTLLGLALLSTQRYVKQVQEPQVHLWIVLELAVLLQNTQDTKLSKEDQIALVCLDQNVGDGHYRVLK